MANGDSTVTAETAAAAMFAAGELGDGMIDGCIGAPALERRRRIVEHVGDADGTIEFDELREYLGGSAGVSTRRDADPETIALRLYHVDLPKLADAGLVDYDRETGRIEATDAGRELRAALEDRDVAEGNERSA